MGDRTDVETRARGIRLLVLDMDGVLTDGRVYFGTDGGEMRAFSYLDIMGISRLKKSGVQVAVVSGEVNSIIYRFAEKMRIEKTYQGCKEKGQAIDDLARHYELDPAAMCFMGDDVNDIPAFVKAGLAVGVPNGHEAIRPYVHVVTERPGGRGAVREVCELIMAARDREWRS